ncbi:MAG: peptide chain release factor N(5)-glutamine methyltransferase [Schleiferiaceae bacterium]
MKSLSTYRNAALSALADFYDKREAQNVVSYWFEQRLGLSRTDFVLKLEEPVDFPSFEEDLSRLQQHEPVQYVCGRAPFMDFWLEVSGATLIPRPETEELVQWVLDTLPPQKLTLLDVGTGSGAIAIALKRARPDCSVIAIDVDAEALDIARRNAHECGAIIDFIQVDALVQPLPAADIIISNPPYIPSMERTSMEPHVINHEPGLALFVPDSDPLLFYRIIAQQASTVFFEIHMEFGEEMREMLAKFGFDRIELRKDLQGRDRMILAQR